MLRRIPEDSERHRRVEVDNGLTELRPPAREGVRKVEDVGKHRALHDCFEILEPLGFLSTQMQHELPHHGRPFCVDLWKLDDRLALDGRREYGLGEGLDMRKQRTLTLIMRPRAAMLALRIVDKAFDETGVLSKDSLASRT